MMEALGQRSRWEGFKSQQIRDRSPNREDKGRWRSGSSVSQKAVLPDLQDVIREYQQQENESINLIPAPIPSKKKTFTMTMFDFYKNSKILHLTLKLIF